MRLIGLAVILTVSPVLLPLATGAQQAGKVYRVGVLVQGPPATVGSFIQVFRQSLQDLGYVDGRNLQLEVKVVERQELLSAAAAELVRLPVDVITAATTLPALAAKRATSTIPIVMVAAGDPVHSGLVASLARPSGNITGNSSLTAELSGKQIELLKETTPGLSRVAVLWNGTNPTYTPIMRETEIAVTTLGIRLEFVDLRSADQIEDALATIMKRRVDALLLMPDPVIFPHLTRLADFGVRNRLPTISLIREFADAGSLMSYGPSLSDLVRRSAIYVDKILRGTKPADLPVEQPTKFELVINMKTAKALGLTIPQTLPLRADHVIE